MGRGFYDGQMIVNCYGFSAEVLSALYFTDEGLTVAKAFPAKNGSASRKKGVYLGAHAELLEVLKAVDAYGIANDDLAMFDTSDLPALDRVRAATEKLSAAHAEYWQSIA